MNKKNKKGIAIIMVLGVCFILLALGTVLMLESYSHMGMTQKYYCETEALNIAEAGVAATISFLENKSNLGEINTVCNSSTAEEFTIKVKTICTNKMGKGEFLVQAFSNIVNNGLKTIGGKRVPAYSILIISEGRVDAGGTVYKKTVETMVNYQLIPYAAISEGTIDLGAGTEKEFDVNITSIKGFSGNIHNNYSGLDNPYKCDDSVNLSLNGGTISTCCETFPLLSDIQTKTTDAGGYLLTKAGKKTVPTVTYSTLSDQANATSEFIELDENIPGGAEFRGKLKNEGGFLYARIRHYFVLGIPIDSWELVDDYLPENMEWDSETGTLIIEENTNYIWEEDELGLELKNINIKIEGEKSSGLFVEGDIKGDNIGITADSFALVATDDIILTDAKIQITASPQNDGVAIYAGNTFKLESDTDEIPAGGNRFKGIIYTNKSIDVTNKYQINDPNNVLSLEGLVISVGDSTGGIKIQNQGAENFQLNLIYNPYVARDIVNYRLQSAINLQPVYWKVE